LSLRSRQLKAQGEKGGGVPILRGLQAALRVGPPDISGDLEVVDARIALQELEVPAFAWFESLLSRRLELAGSGTLSFEWVQSGAEPPKGQVELSLEQFSYKNGDRSLRFDASLSSTFEQPGGVTAAFDELELSLKNVRVAMGDERSGTWSAVAKSNSLRWRGGRSGVQGTFDVTVDGAPALLPLMLPEMPSRLAASLLQLEDLETRLAF